MSTTINDTAKKRKHLKRSKMKVLPTATPKGTTPNNPNRNKLKRVKSTKEKVVLTQMDIVENNIAGKVFSGKELTSTEKQMLDMISKKYMEDNKKAIKHSWDIELSTYLNQEDSPKKHFLIKSRLSKEVDYTWIASALAEAHINAIFKGSEVVTTLFQSKKFIIEADVESMIISLKNFKDGKMIGQKHLKKYTLDNLPLFRNVIETMK